MKHKNLDSHTHAHTIDMNVYCTLYTSATGGAPITSDARR